VLRGYFLQTESNFRMARLVAISAHARVTGATVLCMTATYRAVMLTKKGGPEVLQIVELPIEPPGPGQPRVRVRAAGVGSTDLIILARTYRYAPKIPFVPGYEVAGVVEDIGAGVIGFEVGQRVAALTVYGGFAELLVRKAEHFPAVPDGVSDRNAAAVILNYVTAWQMIHRVAKVRPARPPWSLAQQGAAWARPLCNC
jgi:NADPH:quinone reductase